MRVVSPGAFPVTINCLGVTTVTSAISGLPMETLRIDRSVSRRNDWLAWRWSVVAEAPVTPCLNAALAAAGNDRPRQANRRMTATPFWRFTVCYPLLGGIPASVYWNVSSDRFPHLMTSTTYPALTTWTGAAGARAAGAR